MTSPAKDQSPPPVGEWESAKQSASWADAPLARITRLVADTLDVPVALLSLQRAEEYRFRVNIGLDGFESVPSRISFCAYTMLCTDVLVVPDSRQDSRFAHNPLVLGAPHIVAYVGVALLSSHGATLGTLCAVDHRPREFTAQQLAQLRGAADLAALLLEAESASLSEQHVAGTYIRQLQRSLDAERVLLARTLLEGIAQDLFALRLQSASAGVAFTRALDRSIGDICDLANGLLPGGLPHLVDQARVSDAARSGESGPPHTP